MLALVSTIVLAVVVTLLLVLVSDRFERRQQQIQKKKQKNDQQKKSKRYLVPILAAIAAVLLAAGTDKIESWFSDPRPRVAVDHKGNEFLIKLETHNPTSGIAISFPVSGRIINVEDLNSRADAVVLSKDVVGHDIPESNNDVEIVLADVKPNRPLSFKILYEPMQMKIKTAGRDRWQFSYSWLHGGSTITKTKWYLIADNSEVGPPPVQTKGLVIYPRALSPEEMKKEYKKGLPRTLLK